MEKQDWEELEKWNEQRLEQEKEKFGYSYQEIEEKKPHKKVEQLVKGLKITGNTLKIFTIIIFIIAAFSILLMLYIKFANINALTNAEVIKTIENLYHTKVKCIQKQVDEDENGTYQLEVKENPQIKFTAIKEKGTLTEDYLDQCHKYYFEHWDNQKKQNFIVNENINQGVLQYETYIVVNTQEEIEKDMNIIKEFATFCKEQFTPAWEIYLLNGNERIYSN